MRKENDAVEAYVRQVLEVSRSERAEADKLKLGGVPNTGSSSSMGALVQPTGLPKSFGPSVPPLPKASAFTDVGDPWQNAIDRGEGPVLPKAVSHTPGAWVNYRPS